MYKIGQTEIFLVQGDIASQGVDVVVNAANSGLRPGSGVCGAIHRGGGPAIEDECRRGIEKFGRLAAGEVFMTTGGSLPAQKVIHASGPVWRAGQENEEALLAQCYTGALKLARDHGFKSIAFPAISTGIYGYPFQQAARVSLGAVTAWLEENGFFNEVRFVFFSEQDMHSFEIVAEEIFAKRGKR